MGSLRSAERNSFSLTEWAGAIGDLGITLPFAFALVIFNGFPPERLLFLWGIIYLATGWYYRVPVSVQPLKAMAVVAIAAGFSVAELSSTALFYGLLMVTLAATGAIRVLERFFTKALVRGIQLGLGFILIHTSVTMIVTRGLYLGQETPDLLWNVMLTLSTLVVMALLQTREKLPAGLIIIGLSIFVSYIYGVHSTLHMSTGSVAQFSLPRLGFLGPALMVLIIPQLPLTLGNAIYAASDACSAFWPERSDRATPTRLGLSIGISSIAIGLGGGFPICHGAGGIAGHARFGGKTGGTTMILGSALVLCALIKPLTNLLFSIPIPVLGALLIVTSWKLITLVRDLVSAPDLIVATTVGLLSLMTRNITIALAVGFILERGLQWADCHYHLFTDGTA